MFDDNRLENLHQGVHRVQEDSVLRQVHSPGLSIRRVSLQTDFHSWEVEIDNCQFYFVMFWYLYLLSTYLEKADCQ